MLKFSLITLLAVVAMLTNIDALAGKEASPIDQKEAALKKLPSTLVFGAADWCPYTCPETNPKYADGIVSIYLKEILAKHGIKLDSKVLPWSRAIRNAENGKLHGLMTVVPGETEKLLFTSTPTMSYQDCFFTKRSDDWQYQGAQSLSSRLIGAVQDYGYGEVVDKHIATSGRVVLINGDALVKRLQGLLLAGRIDTFISEKRVHYLEAMRAGLDPKEVKAASCVLENPLYIAIQPNQPWSLPLKQLLDQELAKESNKKRLAEIEQEFF